MAERNYSKRELDQILAAARKEDDDFKLNISQSLTRIETQTSMTNGRVTKLEKWQAYVVGFCACLSLLIFSLLVPLIPVIADYMK